MTEVTVHTVMDGDLLADASVVPTVSSSAPLESRSSFIYKHKCELLAIDINCTVS